MYPCLSQYFIHRCLVTNCCSVSFLETYNGYIVDVGFGTARIVMHGSKEHGGESGPNRK